MSRVPPAPVVREALALATAGRRGEAVALLRRSAEGGDADAAFVMALWQVDGRLMQRDLAGARAAMADAAATGHRDGARVFAAFLATGTGGSRDWPGALGVLEQWARRDPMARRQLDLIAAMALDASGEPPTVPEPQLLSREPMVASFPSLFTHDECAFLGQLAEPRFKPALIFHEQKQRFVADPLRDSLTAGFPVVSEWPVVHALNRRLATASRTDVRQGETLQILRYQPGQQYRPHLDAIPALANQRELTFLVYLNEDYEGGETDFPELGLKVRGRSGMGLLFANSLPDGRPDPRTRHAGCPVIAGIKLAASRWIRARPPQRPDEGFGREEAEGAR